MNNARKSKNCLISIALCVAAILTFVYTWGPLLYTYLPQHSPADAEGFMVPSQAIGVNYPSSFLILFGICFVIGVFVTLLLARKKQASLLFWVNGLSITIILSNMIVWIIGGNLIIFWYMLVFKG